MSHVISHVTSPVMSKVMSQIIASMLSRDIMTDLTDNSNIIIFYGNTRELRVVIRVDLRVGTCGMYIPEETMMEGMKDRSDVSMQHGRPTHCHYTVVDMNLQQSSCTLRHT